MYSVTAAIADPLRLSVMVYLMPSEATFAELMQHHDASQSNLSNHLAVLIKAGLIRKLGVSRRNSYQITSSQVAQLIELLHNMQPAPLQKPKAIKPIQAARTCYDHFAGKLGVALFDALLQQNAIEYTGAFADKSPFETVALGANATTVFDALGVDLQQIPTDNRRRYAYACLDWTEKRSHLAGALGAAMCHSFMQQGWVVRNTEKRVVSITTKGKLALKQVLGVEI